MSSSLRKRGLPLRAILVFKLFRTLLSQTRSFETKKNCEEANFGYRELLLSPGVLPILVLFLADWALGNAMRAINPVFWFTSVPLGGWDFTEHQISILSGATGLVGIIWSVLGYPSAHARLGSKRILNYCGIVLVALQLWPVASNQLLRNRRKVGFFILLPIFSVLQAVMSGSSNGKSVNIL